MAEDLNRSVVNRIIKLLALAESSDEFESKLAAERANELLIKYNLNVQEVQSQKGVTDFSDYTEDVGFSGTRIKTEHKFVLPILQRHFFIRVIRQRSRKIDGGMKTEMLFLGQKTNVEIAKYVNDFLMRKFRELWNAYKKEHGLREGELESYYHGLKVGLDEQLTEAKRRTEAECKALVLVDEKLMRFLRSLHGRTGTHTVRADKSNHAAVAAGTEHGKAIRIQKGIAATQAARLNHKPKLLSGGTKG